MRRLPLILAVTALVIGVPGAAVISWLDRVDAVDVFVGVAFALLCAGCAVTGAIVATRVPGNRVGWLILALAVGVAVLMASAAYFELGALTPLGPLPGQDVAAWVTDVCGIPVFFGLTGGLLLLFPDGRLVSPGWRWFAWAFFATVIVASASYALAPHDVGAGIANPFALGGEAGRAMRVIADLTDLLALPAMTGCAASVVQRLRRSQGVEREQLKWFSYCAAVGGAGLGCTVASSGIAADVAFIVGLFGVVMLPITAGIAILRYRLYDIDVVIKRTLVYGSLTAALVATYFVLVLTLQALLRPVAGDSQLAVAASTLAVAALFRPLRAAIQRGVDRRFFRARYDAARTVSEFTDRLRVEVDLESLGEDLRAVVRDTMHPSHLSLWLRKAPR